MATITKSFTEDVESSHKASWVFTFTCANVTASGSTVSVAVPTVTAKMTASGKTSARAFVNFANLYVGSIDANRSYAWYLESSWASGATKTLPFDTSSGTATPATFNTSALFTSSNKTTRTVNVTLKGEYRNSYNIYFNGSSWKGSSYWNEFEQSVSSLGTIATITLNAPPTFSSTQVSFTNDYSGVPYAGKTTANVTISSLSAKYGGDISSAVLKIGSQTASRTTNGTLSILLNAVGTFTPTVTVTDSRGQTTTVTLNAITVQGYNAPSVSFGTERTTSTGAPNDEGTYAVITPTFTFTDAIATLSAPTVAVTDDGGVGRTPTVTWYSTRAADGTLSGSVTWANLSSGDTVYGLVSITNGFNTQKSYQISVTPEDSEDTGTTITQTLGSAFYTVDFYAGGHGIAFGKPASDVGFEVAMDTTFEENVYIDLPDYQTAGSTDKAIYDAVVALGWDSEVLVNFKLAFKELVKEALTSLKADYVIEQGKSGIWRYRKWNNGIFECFGFLLGNWSVNTSAGAYSSYRSTAISIPAFPITFTENPVVVGTLTSGSNGAWVNNIQPSTTGGTLYLSSGTSQAAATRYIALMIKGRWK